LPSKNSRTQEPLKTDSNNGNKNQKEVRKLYNVNKKWHSLAMEALTDIF